MFTIMYQNNNKKNIFSTLFLNKVILQTQEFYTKPIRVSHLRLLCTLAGHSPAGWFFDCTVIEKKQELAAYRYPRYS